MGCSINYTKERKQIKQLVVTLAQVNKRFNPVKVLPKASHCQSEFKVHMVLHDLFFSFMLFMSQAYSSKQLGFRQATQWTNAPTTLLLLWYL